MASNAGRVLIVDDDPALLEALPQTLRLRMPGLMVDTCRSAPTAIQRVQAVDYDAVVSDIKMPGIDGLVLLEQIRVLRPHTPTLLITGHGEDDLAIQALRGGAYDFIQKPIDREYFVASLARALNTRRLQRQVEQQALALAMHAEELETAVEERTRELMEANRAKDELLAARDQALEVASAAQRAMYAGQMGTWDWDIATGRVTWSESLEALYGLAPGTFDGTFDDFMRHVHPDDRQFASAAISRALEERSELAFEHRIVRQSDGATRWLDARGLVVLDDSGKPAGMRGVSVDVTERKRAEVALAQRQRQQAVVTELGRLALEASGTKALMEEAVRRLAETLAADYVSIAELVPEPPGMRRRTFWASEAVRQAAEALEAGGDASLHDLAGYRVAASAPVIVEDHRTDERFAGSRMQALGMISGALVPIAGEERPFGILGAHMRLQQTFTADDINFLQAVANVLGTAIERERADAALRRSEEQLSDFLERATEGLHWVALDGTVLWANQAQLDMLGYTRDEYVGSHITGFYADPAVAGEILGCLAGGEDISGREARLRCKDGSIRHVLLSSSVLRDGGRPVHTRCIARDITDRKLAEEAVRARERQQAAVAELGRSALEGGPIGELLDEAVRSVAETLAVEYSAVLERSADGETLVMRAGIGWAPELIGHTTFPTGQGSQAGYTLLTGGPVIVEDHATERRFSMPGFALEGGIVSGITVVIRGEALPYGVLGAQTTIRRVFTPDDVNFMRAIANVIATAVQRQRHEEAQAFLERATAVLTSSLDYETTLAAVAELSVPTVADWCAVHLVDGDGPARNLAITHVDPAKAAMARELREGYPTGSDVSSFGIANVVRTGQPDLYAVITDEALRAAARDEQQLRLMREVGMKSAMVVPLKARARVLGAIIFVSAESGRQYDRMDLAFAEELASRAALAVDNARLYRQAQEAARLREEFLSIASHELRSPLTSILGFSARLARVAARPGSSFDEESRSEIETLHTEAERMRRTLELFLDLARLEGNRISLEIEPLDLHALLRQEVAALRRRYPRAAIAEQYCEERALLVSDGNLIRQVVTNLMDNAVKYGGNPPEVLVMLGFEGGRPTVRIRDNGLGIAEEDQEHVFERFYRQRRETANRPTGLGLGLYISREIASLLDATLTFETKEGEGTEFAFSLPLELDEEDDGRALWPEHEPLRPGEVQTAARP